MRSVVTFLLFVFLSQVSVAQPKRIWVDSDIMIGKFRRDVDDGLALIMLLKDSSLQIEGISFVHGVDYAEKVTAKLLQWYAPERNIPTFKGADDSTGFGKTNAGVEALVKALEKGPMYILALGPMTNVGTVIKLRPDLHKNILGITYCAGRRPGMVLSIHEKGVRFSDYNFDLDPKASATLLGADFPVLLAGFDCSNNLFIDRKDFVHLRKSKNKGDRWLYRQLSDWNRLWHMFIGSRQGFIPFDCSTIGALLYPSEFESVSDIPCYIKTDVNDSKNTVSASHKPYLLVKEQKEGKLVSYCEATKPEFKARLLKAIDHPAYR